MKTGPIIFSKIVVLNGILAGVLSGILCGIISCAKPTYIQETTPNTTQQKLEANSCQIKLNQYCLQWRWQHFPTNEEDAGKIQVRFFQLDTEDQFPILSHPEGVFAASFWMDMGNGKGHGTAPLTLTENNSGTYVLSDIYLIMRGNWQLRLQLTTEDGNKNEIIIPIDFN
jgi:hypothetical protein